MNTRTARSIGLFAASLVASAVACTPPPDLVENVPAACLDPGAGSGALRRLTNREFSNAVSAFIGRPWSPPRDLPPDIVLDSFDNLAESQLSSALLVERYEDAVADAVRAGLDTTPMRGVLTKQAVTFEAPLESLGDGVFAVPSGASLRLAAPAWLPSSGSGRLEVTLVMPSGATGAIDVRFADGGFARFSAVTGTNVVDVTWSASGEPFPAQRIVQVSVPAGSTGTFEVGPVVFEGAQAPSDAALRRCAANPTAETACFEDSLEHAVGKAWRREPTNDERARLTGLFTGARAAGDTFDDALSLVLRAILLSPHFLYRVELPGADAARLPAEALAARLSFAITGLPPDEVLLAAARDGRIDDEAGLRVQAERLLTGPHAIYFVHEFFGQWLGYRDLPESGTVAGSETRPDGSVYRAETDLFVADLLSRDRPVSELLSSTETFVNETVARTYGLPSASGPAFLRASLEGLPRRGVLTHPSVLMVSSPGWYTKPAKRGRFVLSRFLCREPPAPPADIANLEPTANAGASPRAQFEAHRDHPQCASCHVEIDPIGFALEEYGVDGVHRTESLGFPVDPSGEWPGRGRFDTAVEMIRLLEEDPGIPRCLARHLLVHALGRRLGTADEASVEAAAVAATPSGNALRELVLQVFTSASFRAPVPQAVE